MNFELLKNHITKLIGQEEMLIEYDILQTYQNLLENFDAFVNSAINSGIIEPCDS